MKASLEVDGVTAEVVPLTFARARIVVGRTPLELNGYEDGW